MTGLSRLQLLPDLSPSHRAAGSGPTVAGSIKPADRGGHRVKGGALKIVASGEKEDPAQPEQVLHRPKEHVDKPEPRQFRIPDPC